MGKGGGAEVHMRTPTATGTSSREGCDSSPPPDPDVFRGETPSDIGKCVWRGGGVAAEAVVGGDEGPEERPKRKEDRKSRIPYCAKGQGGPREPLPLCAPDPSTWGGTYPDFELRAAPCISPRPAV
ncbi:hypothetical protein VaNZ11_012948 [Volvox africanus]|uniref:Uncharacterized protein n=1 Tax=Volvox africanus TaxID=51714 RepID=A0ABQ5SFF0_9CHLO|nr:hypothetical protein VaNZ11_012948 [Volvox africanus]